MDAAIQYILYFAVLVVLAVPLGRFMAISWMVSIRSCRL